MKSTMNEILRKKIEQAAIESRMASAETLTTFGLQSSIDDVVELTGMELSYDEVAESAFEKGAEYALSHQWISVDEALPDDNEIALFIDQYGSMQLLTMSDIRAQNKILDAMLMGVPRGLLEESIVCLDKIVAWMPIPKLNLK